MQMAYGPRHLKVNPWKLPKIINERGDVGRIEIVSLFFFLICCVTGISFTYVEKIPHCLDLESKMFNFYCRLNDMNRFLKLVNKLY